MPIRVIKLLNELDISLDILKSILDTLGYKDHNLSINTMIPDDIEILVRGFCSNDIDFLKLVEIAVKEGMYGNQKDSIFNPKIVGYMDLDSIGKTKEIKSNQDNKINLKKSNTTRPLIYSDKQSFWISELAILSPNHKVNVINIGSFIEANNSPLYSVLIGSNGAGKSILMKEIVDFFVDLHSCVNQTQPRSLSTNKGRLKGIRYFIDGVECEVVRLEKNYFARIDKQIRDLKELRLPAIVACHFGAFDKFPTQKVNGSTQTKYDVPYYKYVGAHVNGSMISSSAIAFRLLFALNEQMDDRQRHNICSILNFIGYDPRIALSYTLVLKSKKNGEAREIIAQRVDNDREYSNLSKQEKNTKTNQLYIFYKNKASTGKTRYDYVIDFERNSTSEDSLNELQCIYKLKQCDLVNSVTVIFFKEGLNITSDEMSSGEFAMLSTVLSISAAANDPHTLVLLDEPELSLHPNWQMTLIDNLDRALASQVCHLIISTHSHMLVSDLPMQRSNVTQLEKDEEDNLIATSIVESTYGWSAEEVLLKVFKTATDRNRYFGERIGKLLEKMGNNTIKPDEVTGELKELQEISMHLSNVDPMKMILNTIIETYNQ